MVVKLNLTLIFVWLCVDGQPHGEVLKTSFPVDGPGIGKMLGVDVWSSAFNCLLLGLQVAPWERSIWNSGLWAYLSNFSREPIIFGCDV